MPTPSPLLSTALSLIAAYNSWSPSAILAPRTPNCTHHTLPLRLGSPPLNNTQYGNFISTIMPYMANYSVTVTDTYVDEAQKRVVMQAVGSADSVVGRYENEYVVVMFMTEDGGKIWEVREFVDAGVREEFFPRLMAYIQGGGAPIGE